ncbi:MAG TPA: MFS transporter [Alphaproteobacteria bacterium]|nr:MFS transporter [Alphaproteobacteria bacterium]
MAEKTSLTLLACLISFLGYFGGSIYIAALPELSQVFHVPSGLIKFSISIYFIGLMIGTICSGPFAELFGRMRALTFFLVLSFISALICAFSPAISWFLLGRILEGIGNAGGPILVMAIVADHFEGPFYHKLISFVIIMVSLAPGAAPIFGSIILEYFDWRVLFFVVAVLEAIALGFWLYVRLEPMPVQRKIAETLKEYVFFLTHPSFRYYLLMIGSLYGTFYVFIVLSPYIFRLHYGWRIIDFAWIGLALAFANSLGAFLNKELIEKMTCQKILQIGFAVMTSAFLLLLFFGIPTHALWLLGMVSLFFFGDSLISACLTTDALKLGVHYTSLAASLVNLSKVTLVSIVLLMVPFLPETLGTVMLFIFATLLVCLFGYFKIRKSF